MNAEAHALRAALPDLADRTQGQLHALYDDPSEERAHLMVRALHEVATVATRLASALRDSEAQTV